MKKSGFGKSLCVFLSILLVVAGIGALAVAQGSAASRVNLSFLTIETEKDVIAALQQIIRSFEEKNPGIKVSIDYTTWDNLGEKLLTSFAAGTAPDVITTGSDWIGPYAERKQFLPLDSFFKSWDESKDFYEDMIKICSYHGKLYGIPYVIDIRPLVYRKDFFQEAGLDPNRAPETWDELKQFALKLTKRTSDGRISVAGYNVDASRPAGAFFEFWYYLRQAGGYVTNTDWGNPARDTATKVVPVFNGPEGIESLMFLDELVNKLKVSPIAGMQAVNPNMPPILEGKIAMAVGFYPIMDIKKYAPQLEGKIGVALPTKKKYRLTYTCPNIYAIAASSKHPKEAFELIKWLTSPENMPMVLAPQGTMPSRKSVTATASYMQDPKMQMAMRIPDLGYGTTTPQELDFSHLEIIGNAVQGALRKQMSAKEALDRAAKELDNVLKRMGKQ